MDMFQVIRNKYSKLDVCINNAGVIWQQAKLSEAKTEEWKEMWDVSVILSYIHGASKLFGVEFWQ